MAAARPPSSSLIQWIVRPTTLDDENPVTELLTASYETLLQKDYDARILEEALPLITTPRPDLLTCGTWYVVEHPSTGALVGCGGWTRENPSNSNKAAKNGPFPHVRHVATHPNALRQGVATAIWNRILQDVGPDTTLEVYSTLTAQAFYESKGFCVIGPIDIPIPLSANCKFPSVIMRRCPPN